MSWYGSPTVCSFLLHAAFDLYCPKKPMNFPWKMRTCYGLSMVLISSRDSAHSSLLSWVWDPAVPHLSGEVCPLFKATTTGFCSARLVSFFCWNRNISSIPKLSCPISSLEALWIGWTANPISGRVYYQSESSFEGHLSRLQSSVVSLFSPSYPEGLVFTFSSPK